MAVFWVALGLFLIGGVGLFYAANKESGQAMPIAAILIPFYVVFGLLTLLILHVVIRRYF